MKAKCISLNEKSRFLFWTNYFKIGDVCDVVEREENAICVKDNEENPETWWCDVDCFEVMKEEELNQETTITMTRREYEENLNHLREFLRPRYIADDEIGNIKQLANLERFVAIHLANIDSNRKIVIK